MIQLPEPTAYLYHDAATAEVLNANPMFHSVLLALASDRRPWARNETPLYTQAQLDAAVSAEREHIRARLLEMDGAVNGRHNYYAHAAVVLFGPNVR